MANFTPTPVFFGSDLLGRSVWVVVDPRDVVTGRRLTVPLEVRLKDVAAEPIATYSGVYCFTDLKLTPGTNYTVQVKPLKDERTRYFDGEQPFTLAQVPPPVNPVKRNLVEVKLLPRTSYLFEPQTTLARGRLVKASDKTPIENADIFLTFGTINDEFWQRTDERGEFVIFFPRSAPEDDPSAGLKEFKFTLKFKTSGNSHTTNLLTVKEGTSSSLVAIEFPGT